MNEAFVLESFRFHQFFGKLSHEKVFTIHTRGNGTRRRGRGPGEVLRAEVPTDDVPEVR